MLEDGRWTEDLVAPGQDEISASPLKTLGGLLLAAAGGHVEQLGLSVLDLQRHDRTWMLSRWLVRVNRFPRPAERLRVTTWPSGVSRLFAQREFRLGARDGKLLAMATSAWLLIDLKSRRPIRPDPLISHLTVPERALNATLGKLEGPLPRDWISEHKVQPADIDANGHVTSTSHLAWIEAGLRAALGDSRTIREIEINYIAESFEGDELIVEGGPAPGDAGRHVVGIVRPRDRTLVSRAVFEVAPGT